MIMMKLSVQVLSICVVLALLAVQGSVEGVKRRGVVRNHPRFRDLTECPPNFDNQLDDDGETHCYMNIDPHKLYTWRQAKAHCQSLGAWLWNPTSNNQFNYLKTLWIEQGIHNNLSWIQRSWVGANTTTSNYPSQNFKWVHSNTPLPFNSPWWSRNEPNNFPGSSVQINEGCVHMWLRDGEVGLNDFTCNAIKWFSCEISFPIIVPTAPPPATEPQTTPEYCPPPAYIGSNSSICQNLSTIYDACNSTRRCNGFQGLYCNTTLSSCQCPTGRFTFWSIDSRKCVYCAPPYAIFTVPYNDTSRGILNAPYRACYFLSTPSQQLNWDAAYNQCPAMRRGAFLIEILAKRNWDALIHLFNRWNTGSTDGFRVWLGANSTIQYQASTQFRWRRSNVALPSWGPNASPFWCNLEPNNFPDRSADAINEGCVFSWFFKSGTCMNDFNCNSNASYLCQFNG